MQIEISNRFKDYEQIHKLRTTKYHKRGYHGSSENIEKPISPVQEYLSKNKNDEIPIETEIIIDEAEKNNISETAKSSYNKKISFFNIFLILIISFIALIIVLDTFKTPINNFLPGFIFFLENFYLTLDDLLLFLTDLIRQ